MQSRPDVVSGDAHVFACVSSRDSASWQIRPVSAPEVCSFRRGYAGNRRGSRGLPRRRVCRHRQQPCLPQRRLCSPTSSASRSAKQLRVSFCNSSSSASSPYSSASFILLPVRNTVPAGGSFSVPAAPAALYPVHPQQVIQWQAVLRFPHHFKGLLSTGVTCARSSRRIRLQLPGNPPVCVPSPVCWSSSAMRRLPLFIRPVKTLPAFFLVEISSSCPSITRCVFITSRAGFAAVRNVFRHRRWQRRYRPHREAVQGADKVRVDRQPLRVHGSATQ